MSRRFVLCCAFLCLSLMVAPAGSLAGPLGKVTLNDGSQGGLYVGVELADGTTLGQTDGEGQGSSQ